MADRTAAFPDRLARAVERRGTAAVVGIDPVLERLPAELRASADTPPTAAEALERFAAGVIEAVADIVPAVKINIAFFEVYHEHGLAAYRRTIRRAQQAGLLVIADIKRGDIGSTARLYARAHLAAEPGDNEPAVPDAVTLAGYLGAGAVAPFVELAREAGRGLYVLVRPSDPGADEVHEFGGDQRFYQKMAELVDRWGAAPELIGECGLSCVGAVVAAKDAASTRALRNRMPHTPWLVPGYGAQGATAADCQACFLPQAGSAVVNASRSVIYAFEQADLAAAERAAWMRAIADAARHFAADISTLGAVRHE